MQDQRFIEFRVAHPLGGRSDIVGEPIPTGQVGEVIEFLVPVVEVIEPVHRRGIGTNREVCRDLELRTTPLLVTVLFPLGPDLSEQFLVFAERADLSADRAEGDIDFSSHIEGAAVGRCGGERGDGAAGRFRGGEQRVFGRLVENRPGGDRGADDQGERPREIEAAGDQVTGEFTLESLKGRVAGRGERIDHARV